MIEKLQHALLHDEGYRQAFVANVACAIMDTKRIRGETIHEWRNRCGNTFVNYLTAGHKDDPISQMDLPGSLSVAVAASGLAQEQKG